MRTLDRYLIRETLGPFALALALFTFLLSVQPMLNTAQTLVSKGVPMGTIGYLLLTLLPQALGVTVPMAFLAGVVMALGRFSGDREAVAMMACGVSPVRLIRPMMLLAAVAAGATFYVLVWLMPDANQSFRAVTFELTTKMAAEDVRPRLFYEGFPGKVILIGDRKSNGRWAEVMIADTSIPGRPAIQLAESGGLVVDDTARLVNIVLEGVSSYRPLEKAGEYQVQRSGEELATIDPKTVFGDGSAPGRGFNEQTLTELKAHAAEKVAVGMSPHNEIMFAQQRFAFPLACMVFAIIGVALGVNTRKDGKMAGFAIGIGVIMAYYGLNTLFDGQAKGGAFPAVWARWMPNIILGTAGVVMLWLRTRGARPTFEIPVPAWLLARMPGGTTDASSRASVTSGSGPRVVLVIKVPQFAWPRPRLMDLYVGRRYLRTAALAFVGLLALYYIGEFIELSEKVSKGNATMAMVGEYFYYSTPRFIYFVVPLATLVAVLTTLGALTRTNELTVLRACGVSLYRTAMPLVILALVWSGMLFTLEDRVLAHSEQQAEVLRNTIRDRPQRTFNVANRDWRLGKEGQLYHYEMFDVRAQTLHQLSIFETVRSPYRLKSHTYATQAVYKDGVWTATAGWVQTFDAKGRVTRAEFTNREVPMIPPSGLGAEQVEAQFMNYGELQAYIDRLDESGHSTAEYEVELHRKTSFPFVTLVMTLIAIPFGVTLGRRGALYGIGLAIVLAVSYLLVSSLFIAFGAAGLLPPVLAAWATNILFATAALTMVFTVRT
jgi:LPS export ABC transporter permease LptG/LPS export ABC transporter permease LptF